MKQRICCLLHEAAMSELRVITVELVKTNLHISVTSMMMNKVINRHWMRCHLRQNPVIIQIFLGLLTASHGKECILFEFEFAVFSLLFAPCDSEEEKRSASSRVSQRCSYDITDAPSPM